MSKQKHRRIGARITAAGAAFCLLLGCTLPAAADTGEAETLSEPTSAVQAQEETGYVFYRQALSGYPAPSEAIVIDGTAFTESESGQPLQNVGGNTMAYIGDGNGWLTYTVEVPADGAYAIRLCYYPLPGTGGNFSFSLMLDGGFPFDEAQNLSLPRLWGNATGDGEFERDTAGNDLRPEQVEKPRLTERYLQDTTGQFDEPYRFLLTAGTHTLRFQAIDEPLAIRQICLTAVETPPAYEEYAGEFQGEPDQAGTAFVEAEKPWETTSSLLYPTNDRSTSATTPSDPGRTVLNTIGGSNWKTVGDRITWQVDVPADGWYRLSMRVRQDYTVGMSSYRTLYIDDAIPFETARNIVFPYQTDWYVKTLGDDSPELLYLTAGPHTLSLEASVGEMAEVLRGVRLVTLSLNAIYRSIIMVTGISPDPYRDYRLDYEIPELESELIACRDQLKELSGQIAQIVGTGGTQASLIDQIVVMLDDFIEKPHEITERLSNFQSNMESLGSLLLTLGEQPLEIDSLLLAPAEAENLKATNSFFSEMSYEVQKFLLSFLVDYTKLSGQSGAGKTIDVWVSTGRDQAQVVSRLIAEKFTPATGVNVQISIVDTGTTLIQASLAGKGPHAGLMLEKDAPVNLAMRNGLVELSQYGLDDIYDQFYESAWTPFRYLDGIYALPETQLFDMMFYRTDIFEELGITPPETWDEFYSVMETIQNSNLSVGILEMNSANLAVSSAISMFDRFLFQSGGTYFNEDWSATRFNEERALDAFERTVELYTDYGLDQQFDFYNRFRSGEMVLSIQSYTMYSMLMQAAPEIRGLWAMAPIPGTRQADGPINRAESSSSTGCIMLKKAADDGVDRITADFLKWWVSAETQGEYGVEIEAVMGPAARYTPANRLAFEEIAWSAQEKEALTTQWEQVMDVRQIPGNYVIVRSLTSALRLTISEDGTARKNLQRYNKDINSEIARKRKEFHLD